MADFLARLESFLEARGEGRNIQQLTPDASTREYFRIGWKGTSAIACVYPEPFIAEEQPFLDVTRLFLGNGLPVAEILDFEGVRGVIVLEDMGDRILREEMSSASPQGRDELIDAAIDLIPQIQATTDSAFSTGSIASRLKFDIEKLTWELEFFKTHYFQTLKQRELAEDLSDHLDDDFLALSRELELRASVLCHRDFHAANLMIDKQGRLRIIDHQDARIGSAAYDLVSLLLDRITEAPAPDWLAAKRRYFLDQRIKIGLPAIDESEFADEFRLQTIQRCLKAVGTFSYQSAVRGKTYFVPFIRPMFEIVQRAASHLGRYDVIRAMTAKELEEN